MDNKTGNLVIESVTYSPEENPLTFTNTYTPDPVTVEINGTKTMVGRELKDSDIFTFTLTAKDNAPLPENAQVNNTMSTIDFGTITYDKAGTYEYTIVEEDTAIGGVIKDSKVVNVTVTIVYNEVTGEYNFNVLYNLSLIHI